MSYFMFNGGTCTKPKRFGKRPPPEIAGGQTIWRDRGSNNSNGRSRFPSIDDRNIRIEQEVTKMQDKAQGHSMFDKLGRGRIGDYSQAVIHRYNGSTNRNRHNNSNSEGTHDFTSLAGAPDISGGASTSTSSNSVPPLRNNTLGINTRCVSDKNRHTYVWDDYSYEVTPQPKPRLHPITDEGLRRCMPDGRYPNREAAKEDAAAKMSNKTNMIVKMLREPTNPYFGGMKAPPHVVAEAMRSSHGGGGGGAGENINMRNIRYGGPPGRERKFVVEPKGFQGMGAYSDHAKPTGLRVLQRTVWAGPTNEPGDDGSLNYEGIYGLGGLFSKAKNKNKHKGRHQNHNIVLVDGANSSDQNYYEDPSYYEIPPPLPPQKPRKSGKRMQYATGRSTRPHRYVGESSWS